MKTQNANNMLFDKKLRKQLRNNPQQVAQNIYNQDLDNVEYKVLTNSKDTMYVVFPSKKLMLDLGDVNAAGNSSTISSAGSASTVGTLSSIGATLGSSSTAGTISSAGSIKT